MFVLLFVLYVMRNTNDTIILHCVYYYYVHVHICDINFFIFREMCLSCAQLETKLGEIDRARAIYSHHH